MRDEDGDEVARNQFWIRVDEGRRSRSATDASTYAVGEPIEVDLGRRSGQPLGLDRRLPTPTPPTPTSTTTCLWGYTGGHDSGAMPPQ